MGERFFVEKPFLDQLATLDWEVIDQGQGVPTDPDEESADQFPGSHPQRCLPAKPARDQPDRARPTLADRQADWGTDRGDCSTSPAKSLVEANEAVLKLLYRARSMSTK